VARIQLTSISSKGETVNHNGSEERVYEEEGMMERFCLEGELENTTKAVVDIKTFVIYYKI
jgi:hypothetical protein